MNVDAVINAQSHSVGIGTVIGNAKGEVMAVLAKKVTGTLSANNAEVKALTISLLWARDVSLNLQLSLLRARDVGLNLHSLESDTLTVVQALNNGSICHSEFGELLLDVFSLFSFFPSVIVKHVLHKANKAAHDLARFALGVEDELTWLEESPLPIESVIVKYSTNL
ncbi:Ribonuclease H-like domain containing protein [Trema orientale]|uniref:Ribonuclease H-like domain containing protein n=1 Tax=Trema orientale TaxID=63057 RepID=A0A2P5E5V3_TREOI|nr:Ribonuclease H-like domain containing protein [Trema orientale]